MSTGVGHLDPGGQKVRSYQWNRSVRVKGEWYKFSDNDVVEGRFLITRESPL